VIMGRLDFTTGFGTGFPSAHGCPKHLDMSEKYHL